MREKAKELHHQKIENAKRGIKGATSNYGGSGGFGVSMLAGSNFKLGSESMGEAPEAPRSSYTPISYVVICFSPLNFVSIPNFSKIHFLFFFKFFLGSHPCLLGQCN